MMDKRGQTATIHIIVGIMLIGSGVLFVIDKAQLGGVIAAIALLIEAVKIWLK